MKKQFIYYGICCLFFFSCKEWKKEIPIKNAIVSKTVEDINLSSGIIQRIDSFPSKFIMPRNVDIWLPDNYTKDKKYEVWNENNQIVSNTLSYDFTDPDNFANNFTGNMKGWSVTADGKLHSDTANRGVREGQAITKNPFEEYIVESRVNFTHDSGGYGIYIQSDKNTSGYIFQYDKGFGNGALIIRERLLGDNGKINENIGTVVLAKTKDNDFMTDEWWTSEHDVQIKVANKNSDKQNVEILIDGRVITSDFEIDRPNDENYTGFRSWKGDIDVDHLNISEL